MKPKCESCNSCGMAMEKTDDFALGDTTQIYCRYCTDMKGKLLPFEDILKANAGYLKESQGISDAASIKMATDLLKGQPAWRTLR